MTVRLPRAVQVVLIALAAACLLWLAARLFDLVWVVTWPFLLGGLAASAVEPAVRWLGRHGTPRAVASLLCVALGLALVFGLAAWAAATAWNELWNLRAGLPGLTQTLTTFAAALAARAGGLAAALPPPLRQAAAHEALSLDAAVAPLVQQLLAGLQRMAASLPGGLFACFVSLCTAYFASRDRPTLVRWIDTHLSLRASADTHATFRAVRASAWGMLQAQLLLAGLTFVIALCGLALIGAPYAFLAALAAAVFDLLPIVGPALVFVPWIAGLALLHHGAAALALGAVLAAVAVARWIVTPQVLGRGVGLHPLIALGAMYIGARLAGVSGLLLGPLVAGVVQAGLQAAPAPGPPGPDPPA